MRHHQLLTARVASASAAVFDLLQALATAICAGQKMFGPAPASEPTFLPTSQVVRVTSSHTKVWL